MTDVLTQLGYGYVQRAGFELMLLAAISGAIGPWIAMRSLAFFSHAIGTAAFPGLVAADALGASPMLGAGTAAAIVAVGAGGSQSSPGSRNSTNTGLWLTAALAVGALIASREGASSIAAQAALFGSLLTLTWADLAATGAIALFAMGASVLGGPRWLDTGLTGSSRPSWDRLLAFTVAAAAIAQLASAGSLLAAAMLVLTALAVRPWVRSLRSWQLVTACVAVATGLSGLLLSLGLNLPSGASIAVVAGGAVFGSHLLTLALAARVQSLALAATGLFVALAVAGCGSPAKPGGVVATTPIVGSITASVAGSALPVSVMVPSGADPHEYEPRPSDIEALAGASLVVANGGLDSWAARLKQRSGNSEPLLDLSKLIPNPLPGETHGTTDPHWFHDPRNVAAAAQVIAAQLTKLDPQASDGFRARADDLSRTALALDAAGRTCTGNLAPSERNLVTDHDAFAYLAARLGLKIQGTLLPTQSTEAAASPRQLDALVKHIRELRIKAIFPERALDPKLARSVASQTGASSSTQLDADTLGPVGSADSNWQGMWVQNVKRLTTALSGGRIHCLIPQPQGANR